ncbi:MAG: RIP metalloprotease RseP [Gemmatimonadota bacterium]
MTLLATIVLLGVLIFVHELGHFLAARSVGIRVERFSIGLGPRIFGFQRGDTEYVISAIPLGGYVKMGGMEDDVMEAIEGGAKEGEAEGPSVRVEGTAERPEEGDRTVPRAPRPDDFDSKSVLARAWVISAGVIMNMLFAFVAFTLVAAGWGQADFDTTRISQVRVELLPPGALALSEIPAGATLTRIGDREVELWSEVVGAIRESPDGAFTVAFADPAGEVSAVLNDEGERERVLAALDIWTEPVVRAVSPGTPADRAGIQNGDRILAVDGQPIDTWPELVSIVERSADVELELTIERAGGPLVRRVTPAGEEVVDPLTEEVRTLGRIGILGTTPTVYTPVPLPTAVRSGWDDTVAITGEILAFLRDLVTGRMSARNLGSIVTIGEMSGQAAAEGLPVYLSFMALFSVNLAILNLLPIPVLDGGHLLFLGIEAVRRRPLSIRQRMRWSQVGFVILIGIMVLALGNDFLRLFGR